MNIVKKFKDNISLKGRYKFTLTDIYTGEITVHEYENVVTSDYWEAIANNAVDPSPSISMLLSKAVLGSGTNAPATSDIQLQTEVYRNNLASKSNTGNLAEATAYFSATEVSGTFREAGILTADDTLASRVAINVTKSTTQKLTLDWKLTIGS